MKTDWKELYHRIRTVLTSSERGHSEIYEFGKARMVYSYGTKGKAEFYFKDVLVTVLLVQVYGTIGFGGTNYTLAFESKERDFAYLIEHELNETVKKQYLEGVEVKK